MIIRGILFHFMCIRSHPNVSYFFWDICRFIPESPRWLLTHGKNEKVLKYFRKSAKINGLHMPVSVRIAPVEGNVSSLKML